MYFDTKPCAVCGSEVELKPRTRAVQETAAASDGDGPVGPGEVVGGADDTVDLRVCTNPECPSHSGDDQA